MATPLTDSINALTAYANEVTGGSDTNLSDAVHTLASGYGGGYMLADIANNGADLFAGQDLDLNGVETIGAYALDNYVFNSVYSNTVKKIKNRGCSATSYNTARNTSVNFVFPNLEETESYAFGYRKLTNTNFTCPAITVGESLVEGSNNVVSVKYTRANSIGGDQVYGCSTCVKIIINSTPTTINSKAFRNANNLTDIYVPWSEGAVANAPWGATNATVHYDTTFDVNGDPIV